MFRRGVGHSLHELESRLRHLGAGRVVYDVTESVRHGGRLLSKERVGIWLVNQTIEEQEAVVEDGVIRLGRHNCVANYSDETCKLTGDSSPTASLKKDFIFNT